MALPVLLQKVNSQMLSEMGYLKAANTLFVKFRNNGAVYAYFGVPPVHWHRLRAVNSIGRYMQQHIFKQYTAARISEGSPAKKADAPAETPVTGGKATESSAATPPEKIRA